MAEVDLNCDLGEGVGGLGSDADVMRVITSANVCCGHHAGSALESFQTLKLADAHGVVIGAHPGHADRANFGRLELDLPPEQVFAECVAQVGALVGLAAAANATIRYLKPHGGLYHQAHRDEAYADAVIAAAVQFKLIVVGMTHSQLQKRSLGRCDFVAEGFADRGYRDDGSLIPRDQPGALIADPLAAVAQARRLLDEHGIRTLCVHGDNPQALAFVRALRHALEKQFTIRAFA